MARRVLLMVQDAEGGKVKMQPCDAAALAGLKAGTVCVREAKVHRWWLVEAESAEAARLIITPPPMFNRSGHANHWPEGRVLASGGRTK